MLRHHMFLTIFALGASLAAPAAAQTVDEPAVVDGQATAKTRYNRVLPWTKLSQRHTLRVGQYLQCPAGCTLRIADGTTITLSPGAEVQGASPSFHHFHGEEMATRAATLTVVSGELVIQRPQRPRAFAIASTAGPWVNVEKGTARVLAQKDRVAVVTGEHPAVAARSKRWRPLGPHQLHVVSAAGSFESLPLVTPPKWSRGEGHQPLGLAVAGPEGEVGGSWDEIDGAASHVVEIARDDTFMKLVSRIKLPGNRYAFKAKLPEGRYYARVTASDRVGMISATSDPMGLRVIRAALPAGAYMPDDGTIILPKQSNLRLLDVEDLEAAIDKQGFVKAPTELESPAEGAHQVHLRIRGDADSATSFRLEPRALHARISMTPTLPSWPDDRIRAFVRLADPTGRIDPAKVTPALEVRVAGAPVAARWQRNGPTWYTVIDGRFLDGPSLVEVYARDDNGKRLGWAFVEVVSRRR